jgi:hypothetical protein
MTKSKTEIFGQLSMIRVELPYETAVEQAKADAMNEQIKGLGFRTYRMAYDWAVQEKGFQKKPAALKSGDLIKVFKSVSDGPLVWSGEIDLDRTEYHHGIQRGFKTQDWAKMFHKQLPARLERNDGTVIFGSLEPFCETGTEGTIWCVHEYGKTGYDGLNYLDQGAKLTVYDHVTAGEIEWEGVLDFGPEQVEKVEWSEVMRQTKHLPTKDWLNMTWQNRPVIITPQ